MLQSRSTQDARGIMLQSRSTQDSRGIMLQSLSTHDSRGIMLQSRSTQDSRGILTLHAVFSTPEFKRKLAILWWYWEATQCVIYF